MTAPTLNKEAVRLLAHPLIAPRITSVVEKACARTEITVERVLREYARIGFSDMRSFAQWGENGIELRGDGELSADDSAAIAEVSETAQGLKIKLHDKKGALDSIGRNLGMFIDKVQHGISDDFADKLIKARERARAT